ncbi:MAG: HAD family hydrolase, partial [Clostridia bacterium]|nr:HAD family hydrolase [Clostridia bacterium]
AAGGRIQEIWSLRQKPELADQAAQGAKDLARFTGLRPEDFELYTTYENIGYCKPNPDYYREILRRMDLKPEDCLMVGNDADEDMAASTIGMNVFLLTDCLINKSKKDISAFPNGDFDALMRYALIASA